MGIEAFIGKSTKYKLGDEEINLYPLGLKEGADVFIGLSEQDSNKRAWAISELISRTFKKAYPEATQDEIDNISIWGKIGDLIAAILEVNGFKADAKKLEEMTAAFSA